MNNLVYLGIISTTHGIKGELKITSNFEYPEKAFKVGTYLIIDNKSYEIKSYRVHKGYHMVTLDDYNNINQVLFLKGKKVYKVRSELNLKEHEILDEDLLEYSVLTNDCFDGKVKDIYDTGNGNKVLKVELNNKEYLIPMASPMILKINNEKKEIIIELMEGIDEVWK